jgi:preprotein translocase SecE subunit
MPIGIYKPGQGYWVRVLTAAMMGVVTLATAAWVWRQAQLAVERLPRSVWTIPLSTVEGTPPAAGSRVTLLGKTRTASAGDPAAPETIGTAEVIAYDAQNRALRLKGVKLERPAADPSQAVKVVAGPGPAHAFAATVAGAATASTAIEPVVIQGGLVCIVLLLGAGFIFWFVAMRPGSVEFLIATDTEMKKVHWSNRSDIKKQTTVVIAACFLLTIVLYAFDLIFQFIFRGIGLLTA